MAEQEELAEEPRGAGQGGGTLTPQAPATGERKKGGGLFWPLVSGILVGVGLGLFLAPRRGQELREQAGQRAQELWRRREDVLAQRQEQAAQAAQRAGGALLGSIQRGMTALRGQLAEAIAAGREAAQQAAQEAR